VIMMFGGGLALAAGIGESGLADWLGVALRR
jgi:sodium-dependent dicarboxylate transporter 2/3/5